MSLISALTFVPQGHAAEFPTKIELSEDDYERIQGLSALHLSSARDDLKKAQNGDKTTADDDEDAYEDNESSGPITAETKEIEDELAEYNLDKYDNEPEEGEGMGIFSNIKGLAFHSRGEEDPYITLEDAGSDSDEDEREDLQILPTDNIILAAKTEDDVSHLEVYIYEEESSNLYVHHDFLLPSFPLCLEWVNYNPTVASDKTITGGVNNVAIGTFEPDIEIWDLDVLDNVFFTTILGAKPGTKRRKKKNEKYHVDAVLSLSANPNAKNLLASASADETLKLWDLTSGTCAKSYTLHNDKVSACQWNPSTATTLATGGYDHRTIISDARIPDGQAQSYDVGSDVENLNWDPINHHIIYTSTDSGFLYKHDIRQSSHLWRIKAHDSSLSAFSVSSTHEGLIATGGQDKQLKLWSTASTKPTMLTSRDFDIGKVFSLGFVPGAGGHLVAGGSNGIVRVWNTWTNPGVRKAFKKTGKPRKIGETNGSATMEEHNSKDEEEEQEEEEDVVVGVLDKDGPESDESDSEGQGSDNEDAEDREDSDDDELDGDADFEGDQEMLTDN